MRKAKDALWTWLLPEGPRPVDMDRWKSHGGKWIVFDRKDRILALARKISPFIDSGEVESAKYWNGDPSALCVYSLDRDRDKVLSILKELGAKGAMVWEFDYAWDKNIGRPIDFAFSWFSKFRTILQSYGLLGSLRLAREILKPRK
jgi:hypothetical protein